MIAFSTFDEMEVMEMNDDCTHTFYQYFSCVIPCNNLKRLSISPFIMQSPMSPRKWAVVMTPTQVWWWENLRSFHYSSASTEEKNPPIYWS